MHAINVPSAAVFQALADPTRIRILRLLAVSREEACLCEFVDSLLEPQYKLSRHLKVLRQTGLLSAEKDGRFVYHRLVPGVDLLTKLYAVLRALPDDRAKFATDLRRFKARIRLREAGRCRIGIQVASLVGEQPERRSRRAA